MRLLRSYIVPLINACFGFLIGSISSSLVDTLFYRIILEYDTPIYASATLFGIALGAALAIKYVKSRHNVQHFVVLLSLLAFHLGFLLHIVEYLNLIGRFTKFCQLITARLLNGLGIGFCATLFHELQADYDCIARIASSSFLPAQIQSQSHHHHHHALVSLCQQRFRMIAFSFGVLIGLGCGYLLFYLQLAIAGAAISLALLLFFCVKPIVYRCVAASSSSAIIGSGNDNNSNYYSKETPILRTLLASSSSSPSSNSEVADVFSDITKMPKNLVYEQIKQFTAHYSTVCGSIGGTKTRSLLNLLAVLLLRNISFYWPVLVYVELIIRTVDTSVNAHYSVVFGALQLFAQLILLEFLQRAHLKHLSSKSGGGGASPHQQVRKYALCALVFCLALIGFGNSIGLRPIKSIVLVGMFGYAVAAAVVHTLFSTAAGYEAGGVGGGENAAAYFVVWDWLGSAVLCLAFPFVCEFSSTAFCFSVMAVAAMMVAYFQQQICAFFRIVC